jgi:hypothetical protein
MPKPNYTIIAFILQGRVGVITDYETDENGVPQTWPSIEAADDWLDANVVKHMALRAASAISILNVDTGEGHDYL